MGKRGGDVQTFGSPFGLNLNTLKEVDDEFLVDRI
jgi:hypothetical protein